MTRIALSAALLALALPVLAQESEGTALVDTTFVSEEGVTLRYRGVLPSEDKPGGEARMEEMALDDRVPVGYGARSLRLWKEGDPRPRPMVSETRIVSEFVDLSYDGPYVPESVALAFAEFGDYAYFGIKEALGWDLPGGEPMPLSSPLDLKGWGAEFGLPWWVPGDVQDGRIVIQPIPIVSSRGFPLEVFTHYYVEWQLRRRTGDRIPYWFLYGAGAYFGAEGWVLKQQAEILRGKTAVDVDQATMLRDLEIFRDTTLMMKELETPGILEEERNRSRLAYWRAFRLVEAVMIREGLKAFKGTVAAMEADPALAFEDAVAAHYGKTLAELVGEHSPW